MRKRGLALSVLHKVALRVRLAYHESMRWCIVSLWLAAACAARAQDAQTVFRAYDVGAADPAALQELARRVAGPEGHVTYDAQQQRLLVLATEERQAQVAELLRDAVPVEANIRLEVTFRGRRASASTAAGLDASGEVTREEGLAHTTIRVRPRIQAGAVSSEQRVLQTLVVANGRAASLRVGESVPRVGWLMEYGRGQGWLTETVVWEEVGSFLVVEPLILGNGPLIRLRITPELRGRAGGRAKEIRFASAATEVVVSDGQTYPLGGLSAASACFEAFLTGVGREGTEEALDISVTPHMIRP